MSLHDGFERYVQEVARRLPAAEREDLARELRSLLDDARSARREAAPEESEESAVLAVLRELGPPDRMAESYGQPRRALVGPDLYPAFLLVLKVVLGVVTLVYALALVLSAALAPAPSAALLDVLLDAAGAYLELILLNIGLVTLIFALIQRNDPNAGSEPWDPQTLPPLHDPERLDKGDLVLESAFLLAFLTLLGYGMRGGGIFVDLEALRAFGRFTPELRALGPWIGAIALAELALNVFVLLRDRWSARTRALDIGINLTWLALLSAMFRLPALLDHAGFSTLATIGLVVVWVFVAVELAGQVWRFGRRPAVTAA